MARNYRNAPISFYGGPAGGDNSLAALVLTGFESPPFIPFDTRTAKQLARAAKKEADEQGAVALQKEVAGNNAVAATAAVSTYKVPLIIGGVAVSGLIIYLLVRK